VRPEAGFRYVDDQGNFVQDWNSHLPEDFGDFRNKLGRYRNPVELAKALHSANRELGKKGIQPLTPQSTPEEIAAYRKAMDVPDKPEDYLVDKPTLPNDIPFDDGIAMQYMQVAHRHNISKAAMKELLEVNAKQAEIQVQVGQQRNTEIRDEGRTQLRQLWGRDYDRRMALAERAVKFVGGDVNDYGWRSPGAVRTIAALAAKLDEDQLVQAGGSLPQGVHSMKQAAIDIIQNPNNKDYAAYHGKGRPPDNDVRARVRRMLEQSDRGTSNSH
jgi:hypothetical protein